MKNKLQTIFKNREGFTLIELLVVIGILAVLAAIAIPAVAGLIDRANVAHDNTNANEMTNAIERFASEYELYKNDLAIGLIDENDAMQGRVYAVTDGATTRSALNALEGTVYDKDTFFPTTWGEARQVIETYVKTSSSTFDPKQSDKCYWYAPSCGVVVVGDSYASAAQLNELIVSGKDAKGNALTPDTQWIDLTCGDEVVTPDTPADEETTEKFSTGLQRPIMSGNIYEAGLPQINDDGSLDYDFVYETAMWNINTAEAEELDWNKFKVPEDVFDAVIKKHFNVSDAYISDLKASSPFTKPYGSAFDSDCYYENGYYYIVTDGRGDVSRYTDDVVGYVDNNGVLEVYYDVCLNPDYGTDDTQSGAHQFYYKGVYTYTPNGEANIEVFTPWMAVSTDAGVIGSLRTKSFVKVDSVPSEVSTAKTPTQVVVGREYNYANDDWSVWYGFRTDLEGYVTQYYCDEPTCGCTDVRVAADKSVSCGCGQYHVSADLFQDYYDVTETRYE